MLVYLNPWAMFHGVIMLLHLNPYAIFHGVIILLFLNPCPIFHGRIMLVIPESMHNISCKENVLGIL